MTDPVTKPEEIDSTAQTPEVQPEKTEQEEQEHKYEKEVKFLREFKAKKEQEEKERLQKEEELKQKQLEEEGKWKELLEAKEAQLKATQQKTATLALQNQLAVSGLNPDVIDLTTEALSNKIELDSEGNATNLNEIITNLKADKPSLFETQAKTKVIPSTGVSQTINGLSMEQIKKLPKDQRPEGWWKQMI